jgi:hypothetical protein
MKRYISLSVTLAVLALCVMTEPAPAGKQVPFKGALTGALVSRVPNPAPPVFDDRIEMSGTATHLGRFDLVVEATVDFRAAPPLAVGTASFTAANGDTVAGDLSGTSELVVPGVLVLITEYVVIDPDSGTGRFAGATGSFTIERLFDLTTGETIGSFIGTLSTPRR